MTLDLRSCSMGSSDMEDGELARMLGACASLTSINLSGLPLRRRVARAAAALPALTALNVSCALLYDGPTELSFGLLDGADAGRPPGTLRMDASGCHLYSAGAAVLARVLPAARLHSLHLRSISIGDDGAAALAEALMESMYEQHDVPTLRELTLCGNWIETAGAVSLGEALHFCELERLDLSGNRIGDEGAIAIADALSQPGSALRELLLDDCDIGARGGIAIATSLTGSVKDTPPLRTEFYAGPSALSLLSLKRNIVGDDGAVELAAALASQRCSLRDLELRCCGILERGAVALAAALRCNARLAQLRLVGNFQGEVGLAALLGALGGACGTDDGGAVNTTLRKLHLTVLSTTKGGGDCNVALKRLASRLVI